MKPEEPVLCPSSRCEKGHIFLGLVQGDGTVGFLSDRMTLSDDFVEVARQGRRPELRFRFASTCVQSACRQWKDCRCGVIDEILASVPAGLRTERPPQCSIRPQCRWFQQEGEEACAVCPLVITDLMVEEERRLPVEQEASFSAPSREACCRYPASSPAQPPISRSSQLRAGGSQTQGEVG
jgi:hypothetical protein